MPTLPSPANSSAIRASASGSARRASSSRKNRSSPSTWGTPKLRPPGMPSSTSRSIARTPSGRPVGAQPFPTTPMSVLTPSCASSEASRGEVVRPLALGQDHTSERGQLVDHREDRLSSCSRWLASPCLDVPSCLHRAAVPAARGERVHLRAARLRAAQDRPAAAAPVRARVVEAARVRPRDGAHQPALPALQHGVRAGVAGAQPAAAGVRVLPARSTSCAARARAARTSSRTCWPGCSPTTSSRTRSGCR